MIHHVTFDYVPEARAEAHERFKQTGAPPPEGVRMLGRWHSVEGNRGWLVCEADDAVGVARWLQDWSDLISFEVTPVVTDEEFLDVIG